MVMNSDLAESVRSSDEIELIQIKEYNYKDINCCICLCNSNFQSSLKMNCCNQILHKECFLEWINYPVHNSDYNSDYNFNNKLYCVICKTKIHNFDDIITLGEFVNYIENKQIDKSNDSLVLHYKRIISKLYKDHTLVSDTFNEDVVRRQGTMVFNTGIDFNKEIRYCFFYFFCIFFFLVMIILFSDYNDNDNDNVS